MLVTAFGTSTLFGYWGFHAVGQVISALEGKVERFHCVAIDQLKNAWTARKGNSVVITSDLPEPALSSTLLRINVPTLVFSDEPEDVAAWTISSRKLDIKVGLRLSSKSFCALADVLVTQSAVSIRRRDHQDDVLAIYEKILRALTGDADPEILARIWKAAGGSTGAQESLTDHIARVTKKTFDATTWLDSQSDEDQELIRSTSEVYQPLFERKAIRETSWPLAMYTLDKSFDKASGVIDLTGPSRFLVWGPYLFLPRGRWIARLEFEIAENASGNTLDFDAVLTRVTAVARAELPKSGRYFAEMDFVVEHPDIPVELRCRLCHGAIEGQFLLHRISLLKGDTAERLPQDAVAHGVQNSSP